MITWFRANGPVIGAAVRQNLRHDLTVGVHTKMEFLPATRPIAAMLDSSPFTFPHHREIGTVDDQVDWLVTLQPGQRHIQPCASAQQCCVVWDVQLHAHQSKQRPEEALGLAQWQVKYQP